MKELEIWKRQLLGTIKGMVPERAMPSAVPVCHEVRILPLNRAGLNSLSYTVVDSGFSISTFGQALRDKTHLLQTDISRDNLKRAARVRNGLPGTTDDFAPSNRGNVSGRCRTVDFYNGISAAEG